LSRRGRIAGLLLAACFAPMAAGAATAPADEGWVGHVVPPYPPGWSERSGGCIGSVDDAGGPCRHSIAVISDAHSGMRMILGLESVQTFGREPMWRVVAALEPDALSDHGLDVAHGTCQLRGVEDAAVVAIVRYAPREWLPARQAWRLDHVQRRMVPLAPADVRCINEGYGE